MMNQNIYDAFYAETAAKMADLTDVQALLVALCAMERQWQLYLEWTQMESAYCLQVKPETLRAPMRELLDLLWEQIWSEEPVNAHRNVYDQFIALDQNSFDEEDGQDVDFGNARLLMEAIEDYASIFFCSEAVDSHRRFGSWRGDAVYCATNYLYRLHGDYFADRVMERVGRCGDKELAPLMDEYAVTDPTWLAETARVREDLEAAKNYPANRNWFRARKEQYSQLKLPPLYENRP